VLEMRDIRELNDLPMEALLASDFEGWGSGFHV